MIYGADVARNLKWHIMNEWSEFYLYIYLNEAITVNAGETQQERRVMNTHGPSPRDFDSREIKQVSASVWTSFQADVWL